MSNVALRFCRSHPACHFLHQLDPQRVVRNVTGERQHVLGAEFVASVTSSCPRPFCLVLRIRTHASCPISCEYDVWFGDLAWPLAVDLRLHLPASQPRFGVHCSRGPCRSAFWICRFVPMARYTRPPPCQTQSGPSGLVPCRCGPVSSCQCARYLLYC